MMWWQICEEDMAFPVLKTSAVTQYPLERSLRSSTQAIRFMDGSRQNFPILGRSLRRWFVRLDLLDEQELGELIAFADAQVGTPFAYTDPMTGATVPRCVLSGEQFSVGMTGELSGHAQLAIE